MQRLATVLRGIAGGAIAAVLAGVLVGGLGGRLAMSLAAGLNPTATGRRTENGELIGQFTMNGTLALVLFGGLASGMIAAVVWVVISPWLPARGRRRPLLAGVAAIGLTSFLLISGTNSDFLLLRPRPLILGMLVLLVALAGLVTALLDGWLDKRLRRSVDRPRQDVVLYGLLALPGIPAFLVALQVFFGSDFATTARPPFVGLALVVVGLATAFMWFQRLRQDAAAAVSPLVALIARGALTVAVALGIGHLASESQRILSLG